jgi:nitrogen regulatory protein P-II 1
VCRNCSNSSAPGPSGHGRGQSLVMARRDVAAMRKVEAVVLRERVEIVIDAVEEQTGHVGVTVVEAVGHGRQRGITHEYRGRVFESRFLPKALLTFVVADELAAAIAATVADAARSGNECGDGLVWTTTVDHVTHNRTGLPLRRAEEEAA